MKLCHSEVTSSTLEMYVYHTYKHYIQKLLLRELKNLDNLIFPCALIKNEVLLNVSPIVKQLML